MKVVDHILRIFEERGAAQYVGEDVSQLEHALQAALFAERARGSDSLVAAALLHDFGHLLHHLPENAADAGIDTRHEALGQAWLSQHFSEAVTEPVRLHVAAKRYLCATDPEYLAKLSAASVQSLALQGGPMQPDEIGALEANPFYREAVALRRFDDAAKIVGCATPTLEHYRPLLEALTRSSAAAYGLSRND
jgi:phosphonate degradation associated HDIG domain protein